MSLLRSADRDTITNDSLLEKVQNASEKSARIIGIVFMRRFGLRYRLKYCLVEYSKDTVEIQNLFSQIKEQIPEFKTLNKIPYLFHLGG